MKKLLFSSALLAGSIATSAQDGKGLYFSLNTGYNFSNASGDLGYNVMDVITTTTSDQYTTTTTTYTQNEMIKGSLGKGINIGGAVGYMFHKNIGLELGLNYVIGRKYNFNNGYGLNEEKKEISASMLHIKPTIVLNTPLNTKLSAYAKFGLTIGAGSIITDNEKRDQSNLGNVLIPISNGISTQIYSLKKITETKKLHGDMALGFHAALGAAYSIDKNWSAFAEINMVNLSYAPSKATVTAHNVDGKDRVNELATFYKETDFRETYSSRDIIFGDFDLFTGRPIDNSKPRIAPKKEFPFSSIGINIGIKYSL
jgi:opacity protein-like surface antigen